MSGLSALDLAHAIAALKDNLREYEGLADRTARYESPEKIVETQALVASKRERVDRFKSAFDAAIAAESAARSAR